MTLDSRGNPIGDRAREVEIHQDPTGGCGVHDIKIIDGKIVIEGAQRREFQHHNFIVTEIVYGTSKNDLNLKRLMWCRTPFESTMVDGTRNPCIWIDFDEEKETVEGVREEVKAAFNTHYEIKEDGK